MGGGNAGLSPLGHPHGEGILTWPARRYEGEFLNGLPHRCGVETWPDGRRYEGAVLDGKPHGRAWRDAA